MAEKIIKLPNIMALSILRITNSVLAVILSLFCFISGQAAKVAGSSGVTSVSIVDVLVEPDYGVTPLYGVVEYGMPWAEFIIDGSVKALSDENPIENTKITVMDESKTLVLA